MCSCACFPGGEGEGEEEEEEKADSTIVGREVPTPRELCRFRSGRSTVVVPMSGDIGIVESGTSTAGITEPLASIGSSVLKALDVDEKRKIDSSLERQSDSTGEEAWEFTENASSKSLKGSSSLDCEGGKFVCSCEVFGEGGTEEEAEDVVAVASPTTMAR